MVRRYDSTRRRKAAEQTRARILQAALRLHWNGVTEFEPLAREAGCSLATVRKYFPTRESLFRDCTRTFAETLTMPDLESLERIPEPEKRLEACVDELCRIHESMFGYAWLSVRERDNSPTLDSELAAYEGLAVAVAQILGRERPEKLPLVQGLLHFLSYRALRTSGGLDADRIPRELLSVLRPLLLDP